MVLTPVISRTVSSRLEKNFIGAVELNSSALPLHADLARLTDPLLPDLGFELELFLVGFEPIMANNVALRSF